MGRSRKRKARQLRRETIDRDVGPTYGPLPPIQLTYDIELYPGSTYYTLVALHGDTIRADVADLMIADGHLKVSVVDGSEHICGQRERACVRGERQS